MATAAASSSSGSNSRLRRKSRTHSRPQRAESELADGSAPHPFPAAESSLPPLQPESADRQEVVEADAASVKEKKSAWNKPSSNGVIEAVSPVMGAATWPALSVSTKTSSNDPPPAITITTTPDGSLPTPGPVVANPPPSKPTVSIPHSNSSANHAPFRQKSMKKGGNSGSGSISNTGPLSNGRSVQPSPSATSELHKMTHDKPMSPYKSPREPPSRNSGSWDHGPSRYNNGFSSPNGGNEHPRNYGFHRNNSWNNSRSYTNRDGQMQQPHHQQRLSPRPFPMPVSASGPMPFIGPSPAVRPFGGPIDMSGPLFYIPAPFVAPSPFFFPPPEAQLPNMLLKQIEYYFSFENLCKDVFLRQNMDDEGWVPVSIIANFNRVKRLTLDIGFILNTVQTSSVIEVQGEKLRKRNDWKNWLLPPPVIPVNIQSGPAATSDLSSHLQSLGLEEGGNQSRLSVAGPEHGR